MGARRQEDRGGDPDAEQGIQWSGFWRFAELALVILLFVCSYWILAVGLRAALDEASFQYAALAAAVIGIVVSARFTVRQLVRGPGIDPRNYINLGPQRWWRRVTYPKDSGGKASSPGASTRGRGVEPTRQRDE